MSKIAIVGIGCRYAGGIDSPESFWEFVVGKKDGVVDIPPQRWDWRRYYDSDKRAAGRMYTRRGAFLTADPWLFDPDFFGMSPREATGLDPQQRQILEVAWEALDDAGVAGRVSGEQLGVYVGAFTADHTITAVAGPALAHVDMHTAASASYTMLSNRIAYALNLIGPALTVDTACSSSLVAFHLACRGIADGDCRMALAGGVTMMLQPETFVMMCKGGFLAADGRSKSFAAAADGYGRGEGAGMVVLRRLDDALRDGDRIYAVVEATGTNQDGRTTAITVPNSDSQEDLARTVLARSGIAAHQVSYVEAHGTGTPVGDPLELRAIGRVYGAVAGRETPLGVGSVKATLGHTEAASGIASIIKSALAVHHRTLPPQGWFDEPNPDIPFDDLRLAVQLEAEPVGPEVERMVLAINGFGYGGTNAHAVIGEPPRRDEHESHWEPKHFGVLPLSARSEPAVRALAAGYADLIAAGTDPARLAEAAWTRRAHHRLRAALPFADPAGLPDALREFASGEGAVRPIPARSAGLVFVFSGMGPQWWAMARDLLAAGGAFAAEAARIDEVFRGIAGWSILAELRRPEDESRVTATEVAQPANFLVQVALVRELAELGVRPEAVVGHSVGEVAAAYVTGMLSLREALLVAHHRARLQASTAGSGGMLAVGLPADRVRELLDPDARIDVAAINSPSAATLSGDIGQLQALAESLSEQGIFARMLRVEVPYHSRVMDGILDELRTALASLTPREPAIPLYSTVTGGQVTEGGWDAEYWCANVRQPVRFADAIDALVRGGHRVFLEVGPHPVLSANVREILLTAGESGTTVATLDRTQPDAESLRRTLAGLYAAGALDIGALFPSPAPHLPLPRYPWQQQALRDELPLLTQMKHGTPDGYRMLGDPDLDGGSEWELRLSAETLPWLPDHVVGGARLLPGAAYLEAALAAAATRTSAASVAAEDVRFVAPLVADPAEAPVLRTQVEESTRRFTIRSRSAAGTVWTVHATGRLVEGAFESFAVEVPAADGLIEVDPAEFYTGLAGRGLEYGPAFRRVRTLHVSPEVAVATVDAETDPGAGYLAHPCVTDAAFQTVALLVGSAVGRLQGTVVPVGVATVRRFGPVSGQVRVVARRHATDPLAADIGVVDAEGALCLHLEGVRFGSITPGRTALDGLTDLFYEEVWDLRDPLDPAQLPAPDDSATLVVALGSTPHPRAGRLAGALPHAFTFGVEASDDLEAVLGERLRTAAAAGRPRLHVCVVAGAGDDVAALWTLKRIAVTIETFLDADLAAREATMPGLGDGSVYVTVVTERAFAHPDDDAEPDSGHAALAGARRVLLSEQSRLRWRLIDTDPDTTLAELTAELTVPGAFSHDNADEIMLRNGLRWSPVVTRTLPQRLAAMDRAEPLTDPEANFALEVPPSRILSQLGWRRCARPAPGPGEVELRMQAVGLNYKDPLKVIGLLGERELSPTYFGTSPGMEGVGVITRVGPGVTGLREGDLVGTAARGMLTRYNLSPADLILAVPWTTATPAPVGSRAASGDARNRETADRNGSVPTGVPEATPISAPVGVADLSLEPGTCTSTTAFATAEYALLTLARVRPGETVLVHGAAGGVGSAAIQVAKAAGATVIGTASTVERRAYARDQGADHTLASRSLNFADDVLGLTGGRGADVILSTAPGEALRRNFKAAAEFGRIVEIGKADIYLGGTLDMAAFDKNVTYFSIDLDRMMAHRPGEVIALVRGVYEKIGAREYRPLPFDVFPAGEVARAFDEVLRSERRGRVAVGLTDDAPPVRPAWHEVRIHADARYLITGGFGGFGLATGRWLADKGARHLVLAGRGGATTEIARRQLAAWRALGIEVTEELVDVTDAGAVAEMVRRNHSERHPLRGVFHTAGAVADRRVADLDLDALERVYRPKVEGARALHAAVTGAGISLDQFVLYSSGGSMFGIFGQYNYNAANAAIQAFAEALHRRGHRVTCIGWGHMAGTGGGMAADEAVEKYLRAAGFDPIDMDDGPAYLEQALRLGVTQAAIIPIDWSRLDSAVAHLRHLSRTAGQVAAAAEENSAGERLRAALAELDEAKRGEVVANMLAEQLAEVMGVSADSIDLTVPVTELGLDSLMGVEFGARASKALGVQLISLQLGRSFDLRQAGARIAEAIVAGQGTQS
ncbi:type I polyketide synthase [Nocardia puris]|uniref:type I polyketide synthase n=1 Tax=Nocardia puris TaxID=208602 RepID=UPI002B4B1F27|nr:SDR family NAD(P)-dependent oxidoreductase [Nocardia puris]